MNHRTALMEIREGPLCRGISPMLAALLTLQLSGCAFHSYQDVGRSGWPFIERQKEVRVTMTDSTVHTGQLAELRPESDSASLVDSPIPMARHPDWPVIDVTDKPIEEIAAEVLGHMREASIDKTRVPGSARRMATT